jgi:hypothetical protein
VTWNVLGVDYHPISDCEMEKNTAVLQRKNKQKLICLEIPAIIRNDPNKKRNTFF